jgi:hypothetical protein
MKPDTRDVSPRFRSMSRRELAFAGLAVLVMIVIGLTLGGDFGISIDEPRHEQYGLETLEIYSGQRIIDQTSVDPREHGPFYSLLAYVGGSAVARLRPDWMLADGIHFLDYLSFVLATGFMWLLCRRYAGRASAWIIAGAFFTQPLLFGHAFINPKDIPFLAFTLGGLTLGLLAIPNSAKDPTSTEQPSLGWGIGRTWRWILVGVTALAVLLVGYLLLWKGWLRLGQDMLAAAYNGQASPAVNAIFRLLARNAASSALDAYQARLATWLDLARLGTASGVVFSIVLAWAAALYRIDHKEKPDSRSYSFAVASGLIIGLATAIRAIAPVVMLPLIVLYVINFRRRSLAHIALLMAAAAVASIAAWPYLWQHPVRHYLESLAVLSHFPWNGDILFNGALLDAGHQPWYFVPEVFALQLTLPVLALALLGLIVVARRSEPNATKLELGAILTTFTLPVVASMRPEAIIYNNARQLIFTLPAIFLLAGLGFEALVRRVPRPAWRWGLAVIVLLPGVVGLVRLHPYEYIYYNALAGGAPGVYARFESDYWCTSYREAMRWVNANAPRASTVAVGSAGFTDQVTPFARPDLNVVRLGVDGQTHGATMAIACDGISGRLDLLPDSPVLMTVSREGAVLAQVKDVGAQR